MGALTKMIKVSIICLLYQSTRLADWVYQSLIDHTPKLQTGEAEFFFVANDPTRELVDHLRHKGYPFIININERLTDQELSEKGYAKPEYIRRVYQGYNQGIRHAQGNLVCLINSDHYFSPDWLENLIKYANYNKIITSQLVEPEHHLPVYWSAYNGEFGTSIEKFDKEGFLAYADRRRTTGLYQSGAHMPCLMYKDILLYTGLYPEGNMIDFETGDTIPGDIYMFDKLKKLNVKHLTSLDSIVYHLGEGEKVETGEADPELCDIGYAGRDLLKRAAALPALDHISVIGYFPETSAAEEIISRLMYGEIKKQKSIVARLKAKIVAVLIKRPKLFNAVSRVYRIVRRKQKK